MSNKDDICKFFQSGKCRYGDQCTYSHVGIIDSSQASEVKPVPKVSKGKQQNPSKTTGGSKKAAGKPSNPSSENVQVPPAIDTHQKVETADVKPPAAWGPGSSIPSSIITPTAARPDSFAAKFQGGSDTPTRTYSAPPSQQQQPAPITVPFKTTLQYGSKSAINEDDSSVKDANLSNLETEVTTKEIPPTSTTTITTTTRSWASMAAGPNHKVDHVPRDGGKIVEESSVLVVQESATTTNAIHAIEDDAPSPRQDNGEANLNLNEHQINTGNPERVNNDDDGGTMDQTNSQQNESMGNVEEGGGGGGYGGKGKGKVCLFWEKGICRHGDNCYYVHRSKEGAEEGGKGKVKSSPRIGKGKGGKGSSMHHRGRTHDTFMEGNDKTPKQHASFNNFPMINKVGGVVYNLAQQQQLAYAQMLQQQHGAMPWVAGGPSGGPQMNSPRTAVATVGSPVHQLQQQQQMMAMAQHQQMLVAAQQQQLIAQQMNGMTITMPPMRPIPASIAPPNQSSPVSSRESGESSRQNGRSVPSPLMVPEYDNSLVFSVDVECVATGPQHHDRAIAQIGMVDCFGRMRLNLLVKPNKPVHSYLTPLTGLTKDKLDNYGQSEEVALVMLRQALPRNSILVGMNIRKDIEWLGLEQDKDYAACIDLADLFRVWNIEKGGYTYYGLEHIAHCWLNVPHSGPGGHDAVVDAFHSMSLFNSYRTVQHQPALLQELQQKTVNSPVQPSFAKMNPKFEGCCMGNRKTCTCGAPFYG